MTTPINQFWYIQAIARPDLIVSTSLPIRLYGYLIPFILSIAFDLLPQIANTMLKNQILEKLKIYLQISSYYSQILPIYLIIPLNGLCFQSLQQNLYLENQIGVELRYLNIILSIITIIWLFISLFFKILLCKETLDLDLNCFLTLKLNFIDFLLWVLNLLQFIVIYQFEQINQVIQAIIVLIYQLLMLINIYSLITCLSKIITFTLIINVYGIVQSVLILINLQQPIKGNINILLYIVVPLLSYIMRQLFISYDFQVSTQVNNVSVKHYKYVFAKFLNDQFISYAQRMIVLTRIITLYQIKKQPSASQQSLLCINQDFIPKYLMNYYYKLQLKKYAKELSRTDMKNRNANHYIHYVSILFRLDLNNLALKQINILLLNMKLYTHSRSQAKDSISDKLKSFNTIGLGQKSSLSKSSKSQEVQEAALHQISKTSKLLANTGHHVLTFYQKVRLNILREKVREKLRLSFQYREVTHDSYDLQKGIDLYIKSEKRNQNLIDSIINLVNSKLQFFTSHQSLKQVRSIQLFQVSKKLCQKIQNVENKINKLYNQFPSQKMQSLAAYYQGECLDNYLNAHKITCNSSIQDEKLINVHNNIKQTFFSKDLVYLNIQFVEEVQDLLIQNITPQICQFFKRDYEDLKLNNSIDLLLPDAIRNEHMYLVHRFLQVSVSKFYLKKNLNFFRFYKNIIKPCEFFFEINFSDIASVSFLAFFNENFQTSAFLMVDVNLQLGGVTQNLFEKLNFIDYYLENIKSSCITSVPIQLIIPEFSEIINLKQWICVTEFRFLKQQILFSSYGDEQDVKSNFAEWQNSVNLINCQCLIQVHSSDIYGFQYYVVEIKELKTDLIQVAEGISINSLDLAFSQISDQEASPNSPCNFSVKKEKFQFEVRNQKLFDIHIDNEKDKSIKFYQPDSAKYEINLLSPADISLNPIALNSANPLLRLKQQEYFNQIGQSQDFSMQNSQQLINIDEVDQAKPNYRPKEDTNSSSYAGAKQSQFYKKYEMMQKIIIHHFPQQLKLLIVLLLLSFLVGSINYVVVVTKNYSDLTQFISEIDMIELHSSFMAPHDIFIAMRIAIVSYNQFATDGVITTARAGELTKPFYDNIAIGYNEIKISFTKQLTNPNLQPFFENKSIDMTFMGNNATSVYNYSLNIREALQQTIQNLYQYKIKYENRMSTSGTAIQVFAVANQFHLHFWLEDLTMEIFNYSKNRSYVISENWTVTWVIFIVITLLLTVIELSCYRSYYKKYDKYLNIFKFCNQNNLSHEVEKYKIMVRQLQQNPNQIFQYKFDLSVKEVQLTTQAKIMEGLYKRNKEQQKAITKQYEPLTSIIGMSLIFGIWIVYFGLGIIIFQGQKSYLDRYSGTADIYKLIQDMTYSSATVFQNRDFHYLVQNFSYLTRDDSAQIIDLINLGITNIEKFSQLCLEFIPSKYQVSNDFLTFFNSIQKDSVCDILGSDVMGFLTPFCSISFQGNYLKGVLAALNFMKNQIQTQIVVNNFSKMVDHPFYDNEGGIIMVRVFELMTSKLKQSMLTVTQDQQNVSIVMIFIIGQVLSTIYIIFSCLSILFLLLCMKKYLQQDFNLVRRFVQLLPSSITLLDDQFERYIRVLLVEELE